MSWVGHGLDYDLEQILTLSLGNNIPEKVIEINISPILTWSNLCNNTPFIV